MLSFIADARAIEQLSVVRKTNPKKSLPYIVYECEECKEYLYSRELFFTFFINSTTTQL